MLVERLDLPQAVTSNHLKKMLRIGLVECQRRGKEVSDEEQAIKDRLYPLLADADSVRRGEMSLATYRANRDSQRTDWQAVANAVMNSMQVPLHERMSWIDQYTTTQPGARVLRLAKDLERFQ